MRFAPRYDARLLAAARSLDDERQPVAETWRRVGAVADSLNLPRPSYVHLRRFVTAERERRREISSLLSELAADLLSGRAPRIDRLIEGVNDANALAELRRRA